MYLLGAVPLKNTWDVCQRRFKLYGAGGWGRGADRLRSNFNGTDLMHASHGKVQHYCESSLLLLSSKNISGLPRNCRDKIP